MASLEEMREVINETDKKMAELFEKRMETVRKIAEFKIEAGRAVLDKGREKEVIEKNSEYIKNEEIKPFYRLFIESNMDISKKYQNLIMSGIKVAYSGVEGAFACIAAKKIFPQGEYVSYPNFKEAYKAVERGECNCVVLPIENSNSGEVGQVSDLIFSGTLSINAMYNLKVNQNLVGVKGGDKKSVKKVISHPQALSQCRNFIKEMGYMEEECENTAIGAKLVAEMNDKTVAAIASEETAELYGLEILEKKINEFETNTTCFAVLSNYRKEKREKEDYFSIMFTVKHEAGALAKAIEVIGRYGFNMTKLRSRNLKDLSWQYYFQIEAQGDITSDPGKNMLEELSGYCEKVKVSGFYEEIKNLDA